MFVYSNHPRLLPTQTESPCFWLLFFTQLWWFTSNLPRCTNFCFPNDSGKGGYPLHEPFPHCTPTFCHGNYSLIQSTLLYFGKLTADLFIRKVFKELSVELDAVRVMLLNHDHAWGIICSSGVKFLRMTHLLESWRVEYFSVARKKHNSSSFLTRILWPWHIRQVWVWQMRGPLCANPIFKTRTII